VSARVAAEAAAAHLARKLIKRRDPVLGRRMRGEQIVHPLPDEQVDDEEMRDRRVVLSRRVFDLVCRIGNLDQSRSQRIGPARDASAEIVGPRQREMLGEADVDARCGRSKRCRRNVNRSQGYSVRLRVAGHTKILMGQESM
jgi:hypothetical protein